MLICLLLGSADTKAACLLPTPRSSLAAQNGAVRLRETLKSARTAGMGAFWSKCIHTLDGCFQTLPLRSSRIGSPTRQTLVATLANSRSVPHCYHSGRVFAAAQDERQLSGMRKSSICGGRAATMGRSTSIRSRGHRGRLAALPLRAHFDGCRGAPL